MEHIHCDACYDASTGADGYPASKTWGCWEPDPCRPQGEPVPEVCFTCWQLMPGGAPCALCASEAARPVGQHEVGSPSVLAQDGRSPGWQSASDDEDDATDCIVDWVIAHLDLLGDAAATKVLASPKAIAEGIHFHRQIRKRQTAGSPDREGRLVKVAQLWAAGR